MPFIVPRPLLLLAGALTLTAPQLSATSEVLLQTNSQHLSCPVDLYVQPRFDSGVTLVPDQTAVPTRAGVHLRLQDQDRRPIRSAEITLRGLPAPRGAQPASLETSSQLIQTFHVVSGQTSAAGLTADLWLPHAVSIRNVSVTSISYATAPAWHASSTSACITAPSGHQLLSLLR